jgi:hypothetical protein
MRALSSALLDGISRSNEVKVLNLLSLELDKKPDSSSREGLK